MLLYFNSTQLLRLSVLTGKDVMYRKSSNIRRPQKIVTPNFSWFLIGSWSILTRPIFNLKAFLETLYQDLLFGEENFCLIFYKIVSPKRLKFEKIVALSFKDLWYFNIFQDFGLHPMMRPYQWCILSMLFSCDIFNDFRLSVF